MATDTECLQASIPWSVAMECSTRNLEPHATGRAAPPPVTGCAEFRSRPGAALSGAAKAAAARWRRARRLVTGGPGNRRHDRQNGRPFAPAPRARPATPGARRPRARNPRPACAGSGGGTCSSTPSSDSATRSSRRAGRASRCESGGRARCPSVRRATPPRLHTSSSKMRAGRGRRDAGPLSVTATSTPPSPTRVHVMGVAPPVRELDGFERRSAESGARGARDRWSTRTGRRLRRA